MKHVILTALVTLAPVCGAVSSGAADLPGVVKSFDKDFVRLKDGDVTWTIPRKLVLAPRLTSGQKIVVHVPRDEFAKLKHD